MRVQLQPAYVLHSRPYRDSSQILEVFTATYGRFSLVARGGRRRGRRAAVTLQPFSPLLLSFSGRSEMKTLTASEAAGPPVMLRGERLFSGLYVNELLTRLLHRHDSHPELFVAYSEALGSLASDPGVDGALRRFEFTLLDELGYSFDLTVDGHSGTALQPEARYQYHAEFGLVACMDTPASGGSSLLGADLLAVAAGETTPASAAAAKRLLRQALATHLGGKPLNSRALFRSFTASRGERS